LKRNTSIIIIILAIAVPCKWLLEEVVHKARIQAKMEDVILTTELREKLGQNLAVALLSGFRGIVADFIWIQGHDAWENEVWYKLRDSIELAVLLQPHSISFWDIGAWHMAWNISYGESINPRYPSDAYRLKAQRDWIEAGRRLLEEGIRNNPDQYDLYFKMGWLIDQKLKDPLRSVPYFKIAATYPQAPTFVSRMIGHMYNKAGRTSEAYDWWKYLWKQDHKANPDQMWDKIALWGHEAEEQLKIPPSERVFPTPKKRPATMQMRNAPPTQRVFPSQPKGPILQQKKK
jgi:hypothetical protein